MVSCGLYILGVPHPAMFGFIAAVLRYLPYVGSWIAALLPLLVTFLSTDGWTPLLQVLSFLAVLELITSMIIEPKLYGRDTP